MPSFSGYLTWPKDPKAVSYLWVSIVRFTCAIVSYGQPSLIQDHFFTQVHYAVLFELVRLLMPFCSTSRCVPPLLFSIVTPSAATFR